MNLQASISAGGTANAEGGNEFSLSRRYLDLVEILDAQPALIFCLNDQNRIDFSNESFLKLTSRSFGEVQGEKVNDILDPEFAEQAIEYRKKVIEKGSACCSMLKWQDGRATRVFQIDWLPVSNCSGRIQKVLCVATDVSREREKQLEQQSLAEILADVLHNVGNVINSIKVSALMIDDMVNESSADRLEKACQLMNEHADDLGRFMTQHDQGKLLPRYLESLAKNLSHQQQKLKKEVATVNRNIAHVNEVIASQQSSGSRHGHAIDCSLQALVEDCMKTVFSASPTSRIEVIRKYESVPELRTDEHKVMQIIVNLLKNAQQATLESVQASRSAEPGKVWVSIERIENEVVFTVKDTGVGISKEHLPKVFEHGFTTKQDGHGFGLHSCRAAAIELGGSLEAQSQGPGAGATFQLGLPLETS